MNEVFELLEAEGFVEDIDSLKVQSYNPQQVERLYRKLHQTVIESQYKENEQVNSDPFSYMASASMRGDSACWSIPCRLQKIDFLNNFSALYANRVTVPLLLANPDSCVDFSEYDATVLSLSLLTLLRSRPLIEEGIIRPTVMQTYHCEHDHELIHGLVETARGYTCELAQEYRDEFEVVYQIPEKSPSGRSSIYLSGPKDFLEHDMVQLFDEGPKWRLKSWKFDEEGKVRLSGPRKVRSIERIFDSIAENTTFYLAYGLGHRSRFLSDLKGEVLMLEDTSPDNELQDSGVDVTAFRHLSHSLPILADLGIAEVLRVRKEDRESFAAYQFELAAITKAALEGCLDERAAQEAFQANLLPKLTKLKKELTTEHEKTDKYLGYGAAGLLASVAIGAYGLSLLGAIPIATIATGLLAKGVQRAIEVRPEAKQKNDLYFLVRLLEESDTTS